MLTPGNELPLRLVYARGACKGPSLFSHLDSCGMGGHGENGLLSCSLFVLHRSPAVGIYGNLRVSENQVFDDVNKEAFGLYNYL